jgi:Na+-driven multidrug efflux pump
MIASLVLNNNLRYEGKAFYSMIGLVTGAILNIFGDYIFINVMNLGVFGAGMSTGISQIVSFVILLFLYIKNAQGKISIKLFSMDIMVHFNIFRGGLPSLIRQGLTSISNGVLNNLVKPFGDSAVAAISIVNRYSNLIMCTGLGIGQGLQPVAAFNYGVKDYRRVKNGMYVTLIISTIIVGLLAILGLVIPDKIVWLFQKNQEVINLGAPALRYATIGIIFLPISVTANMLFQSIRKNLIASILSTLRSGAILIPTLLIFSFTDLGFTGISLAQPISDIISSAISIVFIILFVVKTPNDGNDDKNNEIISENSEKMLENQ